MSETRKRYMLRLIARIVIFFLCIAAYIKTPEIYDILDGCVLLVSTQHGEKMDLFVILSYIGSFATVVFCCVYAFVKSRQPEEEVEE